jgi:hypothetical protein
MRPEWKHFKTGELIYTPMSTAAEQMEYVLQDKMVPYQHPGWQWEAEPIVITDPNCIRVQALATTPLLTRSYMDLELFSLAAEAVGANAQVEVEDRDGSGYFELDDGGLVNQLVVASRRRRRAVVKIYHSRMAYNRNGFHVGTEEYTATLPIVAFEDGDHFHGSGRPEGLAKWLVRVDEGAHTAELVSAPTEPDVIEGYRNAVGDFVPGATVGPDGMLIPAEGWEAMEHGYLIDKEFFTDADYEGAMEGAYYRPDDYFVHQEMSHVLSRILREGENRAFNRNSREWEFRNALGKRIE